MCFQIPSEYLSVSIQLFASIKLLIFCNYKFDKIQNIKLILFKGAG